MCNSLQAATRFQILLLFTVVLMPLNPSGMRCTLPVKQELRCHTPLVCGKRHMIHGPTTGARRWAAVQLWGGGAEDLEKP